MAKYSARKRTPRSDDWTGLELETLISSWKDGRGWEEISEMLPGRTGELCRSRFRRMVRVQDPSLWSTLGYDRRQQRRKITANADDDWKGHEDETLVFLYIVGESWQEISGQIPCRPCRTWTACKKRWEILLELDPSLYVGIDWTEDQDQLLSSLHSMGKNWTEISQQLPGRNESACAKRWGQMFALVPSSASAQLPGGIAPSTHKLFERWLLHEEEQLVFLHNITKDFNEVAKHLPGRSAATCKSHFYQYLSGSQRPSDRWTEDEDDLLISLHNRGVVWAGICLQIPDKSFQACRNRYRSYLKPKAYVDHLLAWTN